jgi:hypothetical protein
VLTACQSGYGQRLGHYDVTLVVLTNAAYGPTPIIWQLSPLLRELAGMGEAPSIRELTEALFQQLAQMT